MNDLISRQAAIDALKEHRALYCDNTPVSFSKLSYAEKSRVDELDTAITTLVNLPSAQPERKKGIWQEITWGDCSGYDPTLAGYDDPVVGYVCSCCRYGYEKEVMGDTLFNFCPNCGADMRGEQDE